jgi:hypothetical protein
VSYGPCPELGTEASVEAAKKRNSNACVRPAGKQMKVVGKKKMVVMPKGAAVMKAAAAPKCTVIVFTKFASALLKATALEGYNSTEGWCS